MGFKTTKTVSEVAGGNSGAFYPASYHKYMGKITAFSEDLIAGKDVLKFGLKVLKSKASKDITKDDEYIVWPSANMEDNVLRIIKSVLTSKENDNLLSEDQKVNLNSNDIDLSNLVGCYITITYEPQQKKLDGVYQNTIYSKPQWINGTYNFEDTVCTDQKKYDAWMEFKASKGAPKTDVASAPADIDSGILPF